MPDTRAFRAKTDLKHLLAQPPHFTDKETEMYTGNSACPRSQSDGSRTEAPHWQSFRSIHSLSESLWIFRAHHSHCMVDNVRQRILFIVQTTQNVRPTKSDGHALVTMSMMSVTSSFQMTDSDYNAQGRLALRGNSRSHTKY